jgi:Fic family protein
MVQDHFIAMQYVINAAVKKEKITLSMIQHISSLVMNNTGAIVNTALGKYNVSKGEIRKSGVYAGRRQFPDAKKVPNLLKNMIVEFNSQLNKVKTIEDKLKLSFKLHFDFVSIHPFGDGNGRVSRLLMNYVQAYFKIPTSIVFKSSRLKYIEALEQSRNSENLEHFYKFMFSEYKKFLKKEVS